MPHMFEGMFWGMHFLWWIFLIVVVVWLLSSRNAAGRHRSAGTTPLDILQERFARGEINKEEYEERRRVLEQGLTTRTTDPSG